MSVERSIFGKTVEGKVVDRYVFKNGNGISVEAITLGCCIVSVKVPDKNGIFADITPGYSTVDGKFIADYEKNPTYFGAVIGRVANRTKAGKFSLDGKEYQLPVNNPPNHLHGGDGGFHTKMWDAKIEGNEVVFSRDSPDGEEGYPGCLSTTVRYKLTEDNEFLVSITATTDSPTIINMTSHCYWNLSGHDGQAITDHIFRVAGLQYTEKCSEWNVPNGKLVDMDGTINDFIKPTLIGENIGKCPKNDRGYDINFCIDGEQNTCRLAARLEHEKSGRYLELYCDKPGLQLYTGGYIENLTGKDGVPYNPHSSLALESQAYPNAINQAGFPTIVLRPGETYNHEIRYKFGNI